jgi:regulation of enolase protein 1 (concanavalin A-like superfamily)
MSSFTGIDPYTMTAGGRDIYGQSDQFHFVWKNFSGQGSIMVRVNSLEGENPYGWAKAGVMMRETLDANSVHAMIIVTPTNRVEFLRRNTVGGASDSTYTAVDTITLPHWVRLTRQGNMFTAQHSTDGVNWQSVGDPTSADVVMGSNVFIGLVLTSQQEDARIPITAVFSNVSIIGSVSGQWQSEDIGLSYNAAEPLYVAVEDSTGRSKGVNHRDDPNAVLAGTWQEWNIDLKQVSDAGVNLASVKKMYIGVGDRAAPQSGGGGMLYVDDIRLSRPRCLPSLLKPDADFTDDCVVDYRDLETMANEWLAVGNDLQTDLNLDNEVDFKDYAGLADTWLDVLLWP